MRIVVVGRGLIGTAAAKYLARAGHDVLLLGPDEPSDKAAHKGVFGSHYDEGRITRQLDADPFWSAVSMASIARYRAIETESGMPFFTPSGAVLAGPAGGAMMQGVCCVRETAGIRADRLEADRLAARFPFFRFAADFLAFHETETGGHISARSLVRAQERLARKAGANVCKSMARGLDAQREAVRIATDAGEVRADRALIAAGGYSDALLAGALGLTVYARTVAFLDIDAAETTRLARMPALVCEERDGRDTYLLPPILYPDGRRYLKIGGDPVDRPLDGADAISDWFRGGGAPDVGEALRDRVEERMPGLRHGGMRIQACVTAYTASDRPDIRLLDDRIGVAAAGCGRGAKCSDELGRLAAELFPS